jgi:hypothetical protein
MRKLFFLFTFLLVSAAHSQQFKVTPTGLFDNGIEGKNYIEFDATGKQADVLYDIYSAHFKTKQLGDAYFKDFVLYQYITYEIHDKKVMTWHAGMGITIDYNATYLIKLSFLDEKVKISIAGLSLMPDDPNVQQQPFPYAAFYNKKGVLKREREKEQLEAYFANTILKLQDLAK